MWYAPRRGDYILLMSRLPLYRSPSLRGSAKQSASTQQTVVLTEIAASLLSVAPPKEVPFIQMAFGFHSGCTFLDLYAAEGVNACGGFATRNDSLLRVQKWQRRESTDHVIALFGLY